MRRTPIFPLCTIEWRWVDFLTLFFSFLVFIYVETPIRFWAHDMSRWSWVIYDFRCSFFMSRFLLGCCPMRHLLQRARSKKSMEFERFLHSWWWLECALRFLACCYACTIARVRFEQSVSCEWRDTVLTWSFNSRCDFMKYYWMPTISKKKPAIYRWRSDWMSHITLYRCLTLIVVYKYHVVAHRIHYARRVSHARFPLNRVIVKTV